MTGALYFLDGEGNKNSVQAISRKAAETAGTSVTNLNKPTQPRFRG